MSEDADTKVRIFNGFHALVDEKTFENTRERFARALQRHHIHYIYSSDSNIAAFEFGPIAQVNSHDIQERVNEYGLRYYDWDDIVCVVGNQLFQKNASEDDWKFLLSFRAKLSANCESTSEIGWWGGELELHDDSGYMLVDVLPMKCSSLMR